MTQRITAIGCQVFFDDDDVVEVRRNAGGGEGLTRRIWAAGQTMPPKVAKAIKVARLVREMSTQQKTPDRRTMRLERELAEMRRDFWAAGSSASRFLGRICCLEDALWPLADLWEKHGEAVVAGDAAELAAMCLALGEEPFRRAWAFLQTPEVSRQKFRPPIPDIAAGACE